MILGGPTNGFRSLFHEAKRLAAHSLAQDADEPMGTDLWFQVSIASSRNFMRHFSARFLHRTLAAPLVSPGTPTPFPNPDRQPDLRRGMHSLLANNIWCDHGKDKR